MSTVPSIVAAEEGSIVEFRPAFLRRVRIRGYRSIAFCDVSLEPLTILVGRNGAGKSNFLDALGFVRDAMETNITEATRRHGGWKSILSHFAENGEVSFELEMAFAPKGLDPLDLTPGEMHAVEYGFALREGPAGLPILSREWFRSPEADGIAAGEFRLAGTFDETSTAKYEWTFHHPEVARSAVPRVRPDRLWLGLFAENPFAAAADGLRYMRSYNFDPRVMRPPQKREPETLLTADGRNVASVVERVESLDETAMERVRRYLRAVVPEIETFRVVPLGDYDMIRFRYRPVGANPGLEFDATAVSDGTIRVLACLVAVFQSEKSYGAPSLVAIEEPETALHPAAMRALIAGLGEAALRTQILISTHSPNLLDCPEVRLEDVRVVEMIDGKTTIGPISELHVGFVRQNLTTLGELERQDRLDPDPDDQERQAALGRAGRVVR